FTSASIWLAQFWHLKCLLVRLPICLHTLQMTSVSRVNYYNRDARKQSLVLQKQAKLSKRPSSKFGSKGFVSFFRSKPNVSQIFDSNTLTCLFSDTDNRFCNRMIHHFSMSSFFALKPLDRKSTRLN